MAGSARPGPAASPPPAAPSAARERVLAGSQVLSEAGPGGELAGAGGFLSNPKNPGGSVASRSCEGVAAAHRLRPAVCEGLGAGGGA